ncbi:ANTAR domain-containing protein [Streptomyces kunmingensis]|uniref:ANTAR domain-containing protein n=1 Tax=Streptomyces kunmingensis TaxID=68225 RepID=A0ABU6CBG1_9ACTN|nr:ANTAR domain-containing protein [Streptomyces kunmingensis]MEB3961517.1 ANTAR domain-containing protein [Streptomyces kunmingensis]
MPQSAQSGTGSAATCAEPAAPAGTHRLTGLTLFTHWDGERMIVSVRGDLHLDEDQRLNDALRPLLLASDGSIDLDMSEVELCGCAAVNILLGVDPLAAAAGADPADEPGADLGREVAQLRRAMQSRGTIDMARGVLVAAFGIDPKDAWEALVDTSQRTNIKLHRVAQHLVDSTTGAAPLPKTVQSQLSAVIARLADRSRSEGPVDSVDPVDPLTPVDGHDWNWDETGAPTT